MGGREGGSEGDLRLFPQGDGCRTIIVERPQQVEPLWTHWLGEWTYYRRADDDILLEATERRDRSVYDIDMSSPRPVWVWRTGRKGVVSGMGGA
jgi:hypothetical protein